MSKLQQCTIVHSMDDSGLDHAYFQVLLRLRTGCKQDEDRMKTGSRPCFDPVWTLFSGWFLPMDSPDISAGFPCTICAQFVHHPQLTDPQAVHKLCTPDPSLNFVAQQVESPIHEMFGRSSGRSVVLK